MTEQQEANISDMMDHCMYSKDIEYLALPDIGLVIPVHCNEYEEWRQNMIKKRNHEAHVFTLHFLPTTACQFDCKYCLQKGAPTLRDMDESDVIKASKWLGHYFTNHPEIDGLRFFIFGGEPILKKDIVNFGIETFHELADRLNIKFSSELTTNGEFLDAEIAAALAKHCWNRVQITLDGPREIHNARRPNKRGKPTYEKVLGAICLLLSTEYIEKIHIRISIDLMNAGKIRDVIESIAGFGNQDRIDLSLGVITPTFYNPTQAGGEDERALGAAAVDAWTVARQLGFSVPDEFITGPWCVAVARHSAVLQPNGLLQKCFCTVGRKQYDFASIDEACADEYLRDMRFEHWSRTDKCIEEKCSFLPMCGGGCIHNAIVAHGEQRGFSNRYCQRTLIEEYNLGLLLLNYDGDIN